MYKWILVSTAALCVSACASGAATTTFVSSWKSPTAKPLQVKGSKVAAQVILNDLPSRRNAEDKLAREITARGATGIPMYQIVENDGDEALARDALAKADVKGVVVMSPSKADLTSNTIIDYDSPPYGTYWNGYYDYARLDAVPYPKAVSVDTMIYSLGQNKLVWAGRSKTTDANTVDSLVADVAAATADELSRLMLVAE